MASRWTVRWLVVLFCVANCTFLLAQSTGGRILGRVADPSGAVLAGVKVTIVNEATGVSRDAQTNDSGDFAFIEVPVGTYRAEFDLAGFKKNIRRGVLLEVNQVVTLNMVMQLGEAKEVVEVTSEAPLVDTTSTQLGAVVNDRSVSQLPLNARDTYQFLQLQPGVMSTVGSSNSIVYGSNNSGAVSVNGGRGRSNNFSVNGGDANDQFVNLPTVQPSPDSIEEFRVLTNTFDAEYGRNSGSIVNVVTKSGTNQFHGNMYEFFRNKVLNANGYCFSADGCPKPQFNQNQFGGTFGGPIRKDRTFFFASYEGRRIRQGVPSPAVTVPLASERPSATQAFSDFSSESPFSGTLTSAYALNQRSGCTTALGAAPNIPDGSAYSDLFPGNIIPLGCMDATAVDLLQFVPTPTNGNTVQTIPVQPERGDQFTLKFDHRINEKQNLSFYYYFDDHSEVLPFAQFQAAGANVPGFASAVAERFQQWNLSHTWTINNNTVNEFRFNYNREAQRTFQHPQRTSLVQDSCPTAPAWLTSALGTVPCFSDGTAANAFGIHPGLGAQHEGLPFIQLSGGFVIGNNGEGELPQVGNSFQWSDSISKVMGNHSFKFGGDVRRQRFDQTLYFDVSGEYFFDGTSSNTVGTDTVFPDYLLGFPGSFGEGSAQVENVRSTGLYLFAQDSWKIKPNLTLNYGLRWELNTPIADISQHVQTFRPGQVSTVYPCQLSAESIASFQGLGVANPDCANTGTVPTGLVVPGDAGIPNGLTQTYYKAIAPRIGVAWSPGNSGKTSIRAGWGLFYNPIEQLVLEQFSAEPPFGGSTFPVDTLFNTPFLGQDGATVYPNPFNGILNPPRGQAVDWSTFRPILLFGQFQPNMRSQYSAQYNLTIQRELSRDMKFQIGYVGSQGHRLLATHDVNYGNPQTCLDLNDALGAGTCGPYSADSSFFVPAGTTTGPHGLLVPYGPNGATLIPANTATPSDITLVGLRRYSSPNCDPFTASGCPQDGIPVFSSIFAQDTIANSAYNSLQASLDKRFSHGLQFTAAYTFSKSFDEASSFEGILNPIDPRRSRALSEFDARHRIVFSYYWELPFRKFSGTTGKILNGWALSGITTFQTGFPIRITSLADNELMYSFDFELPGEPAQLAPFHTQKAQTHGNYYFDPNSFTENATDDTAAPCSAGAQYGCYDPALFGTLGNSPRTICCGPHISNTDFAILKTISFTETRHVDFRAEFFNIFNHTQFFNPDGNTSDGAQFGQVTQARDPRLMQFALKFFF
ncbi:MAG TPA: carboxypeptidase regulatory-like domain-containing protein [Terriglobales bacterium]|jgi:outer membrane receptor protein involved in Fe transport|nr:carboxypeptidase regulatory-like domain-containing protein [Terriglobales bacterium]